MQRIAMLLFVTFLFGCSAQVVPRQVAGGIIDPEAASQTLTRAGITVTARVQDLSYAPYRQVDNITSLYLDIANASGQPWSFPFELVRLVATDGRQFSTISPQRVKEIVSRDLPYMVPYPYVGYYYLEDAQKGSYFNSFTSDLPYYAANRPQDIFTQALPEEAVETGNRISGLIYLICDLTRMQGFELRIPNPAQPDMRDPMFVFPFTVEQ